MELGRTQLEQEVPQSLGGERDGVLQSSKRGERLMTLHLVAEVLQPEPHRGDGLQRVIVDPVGDAVALVLLGGHDQPEKLLAMRPDPLELGHLLDELVVDHAQLLTLDGRAVRHR